jgi:AraC-like DNA-binding protein
VNEDQLALGAVVAASLDDFILTTVLQGHPHSFTDDLAAPVAPAVPRIVRCAERYMAENAAAPLTIADIALEVGVSVRALQAGFREWRQTTPMAALRHIRLQCARAALLEPDEATEVTDVALRWASRISAGLVPATRQSSTKLRGRRCDAGDPGPLSADDDARQLRNGRPSIAEGVTARRFRGLFTRRVPNGGFRHIRGYRESPALAHS